MIDVGKSEVRVRGSKEQESEVKEKEKISKILNARATVIMHIYMHGYCNTCAYMHNFTPTDVVVSFLSKCVK